MTEMTLLRLSDRTATVDFLCDTIQASSSLLTLLALMLPKIQLLTQMNTTPTSCISLPQNSHQQNTTTQPRRIATNPLPSSSPPVTRWTRQIRQYIRSDSI